MLCLLNLKLTRIRIRCPHKHLRIRKRRIVVRYDYTIWISSATKIKHQGSMKIYKVRYLTLCLLRAAFLLDHNWRIWKIIEADLRLQVKWAGDLWVKEARKVSHLLNSGCLTKTIFQNSVPKNQIISMTSDPKLTLCLDKLHRAFSVVMALRLRWASENSKDPKTKIYSANRYTKSF